MLGPTSQTNRLRPRAANHARTIAIEPSTDGPKRIRLAEPASGIGIGPWERMTSGRVSRTSPAVVTTWPNPSSATAAGSI